MNSQVYKTHAVYPGDSWENWQNLEPVGDADGAVSALPLKLHLQPPPLGCLPFSLSGHVVDGQVIAIVDMEIILPQGTTFYSKVGN